MERAKNGCLESHLMHTKLRCAWQQLAASKKCFQMLKRDLLGGMAETLEIFHSMSIPLIRLVGMKVEELAKEGRNTTVSISSLLPENARARCPHANSSSESGDVCCSAFSRARRSLHQCKDGITNIKAAHHVEEFSLLHKQQLRQLVGMVKMVEALVRSQEAAITDMFQDCEKYFDSLQKDYILNFKNLHHQAAQMRQQDSRITYRLRVAEQSYQALMSLAIKLQESLLEGLRKNLLDLKAEVEELVNELASKMCKPLIVFLKEFKEHGAATVISKLKVLIDGMESEMSTNIETLAAANDEVVAFTNRIDLKLQAQHKELQALSRQGKLLNKSLEESYTTVEALKRALAQKTAREQDLEGRLEQEIMRVSRLKEELGHKEAKLTEALQLLETVKQQLNHEHCQMAEAVKMSRELCDQLSIMENRLCLSKTALDNQMSGELSRKPSEIEPTSQQQLHYRPEQALPIRQFQQVLTQVLPLNANCDMQQEPEVQDDNNSVLPEPSHGRSLEQEGKSFVGWISDFEKVQAFIERATIDSHEDPFVTQLTYICSTVCQTEASEFLQHEEANSTELSSVTARFLLPLFLYLIQPNSQTLSPPKLDYGSARTVRSDVQLRKRDLKDLMSELQVRLPELNKSTKLLIITIAMANIVSKSLFSGSVQHNVIEQASRGLIQSGEGVQSCYKFGISQQIPTGDVSSTNSSGTLGSGNERIADCHRFTGKNSEELDKGGSSLAGIGSRDEAEDALNSSATKQELKGFPKSIISQGSPRAHEAMTARASQNGQVTKELWQVLELGPENGNTQCKESGKLGADELVANEKSVKSDQVRSEPLLAFGDDVAHPNRPPKTRRSPRFLHRAGMCTPQTVKRHCMQFDSSRYSTERNSYS